MIKGFITVEVRNCSALDTDFGRMHLERGILGLALGDRTEEAPTKHLLKHWEDRNSIYVRVAVQCGSNLLGARMLSGEQATIQYNVLGLSTDSVDDMRKMTYLFLCATSPDFNWFLQSWGGEVVRMAELNVLSITTPLVGQDEYCPGTPYCSGHGTCNRTIPKKLGDPSWLCICDMTYAGSNCSMRVCPPCVSEESCTEGNQTLDSIWECMCPNNCSGGGQCNAHTGICKCDPMHKEIDCSAAPLGRPPLDNCIEVSLVWGLAGYAGSNKSDPLYDENFDFFDPKAQEFIEQTCQNAMLSGQLMVREEQPCWIDIFRKYVVNVNGTFPIHNDEGSEALQSFMHYNNWAHTPRFNEILTRQEQALISGFRGDIETAGLHFTGRVKYVRVRMRSNMAVTDSNRKDLREKWELFLEARMQNAPSSVGKPFMVGQVWAEMSLENDIQMGVATGMLIALGGSLLVVGLFLRRVGLTLLVIFHMILVVCVIGGFLLFVHEYRFGPVEMIGSTAMLGMGVDYCLHLAHGYKEVPKNGQSRAAHAVRKYGASILGGAMTTTIGVFVLTQCKMILFQKLGWALSSNALVSASYTFFFLAPSFVILDLLPDRSCGRHVRRSEGATQGQAGIAGGGNEDSEDIHSDCDMGSAESEGEGESGGQHVGDVEDGSGGEGRDQPVGEGSNEDSDREGSVADEASAEGEAEHVDEGSNEGSYREGTFGESTMSQLADEVYAGGEGGGESGGESVDACASDDKVSVSSCSLCFDLEECVPVEREYTEGEYSRHIVHL